MSIGLNGRTRVFNFANNKISAVAGTAVTSSEVETYTVRRGKLLVSLKQAGTSDITSVSVYTSSVSDFTVAASDLCKIIAQDTTSSVATVATTGSDIGNITTDGMYAWDISQLKRYTKVSVAAKSGAAYTVNIVGAIAEQAPID